MNILFLGDIYGKPGRATVVRELQNIVNKHKIDFTVVNGENAAAGRGISPKICVEFLQAGVAVITTGDHIWDQHQIVPFMEEEPRLLRPINYPKEEVPGQGSVVLKTKFGNVAVINVQGRTFMKSQLENPFLYAENEIEKLKKEAKIILVDFHAEATSEKNAMGYFLDGRVSLIVGTHSHVQTSDERILPKNSGYITDLGMCGPYNSIIGGAIEPVLEHLTLGVRRKFFVSKSNKVELCGIICEIDEKTGKAISIRRIREIHDYLDPKNEA